MPLTALTRGPTGGISRCFKENGVGGGPHFSLASEELKGRSSGRPENSPEVGQTAAGPTTGRLRRSCVFQKSTRWVPDAFPTLQGVCSRSLQN